MYAGHIIDEIVTALLALRTFVVRWANYHEGHVSRSTHKKPAAYNRKKKRSVIIGIIIAGCTSAIVAVWGKVPDIIWNHFASAHQVEAKWEEVDNDIDCECILKLTVQNMCIVEKIATISNIHLAVEVVDGPATLLCTPRTNPYGVKQAHSYIVRLRDNEVVVTSPASIKEDTETKPLPADLSLLHDSTLVLTCDKSDAVEFLSIRIDRAAKTKLFKLKASVNLPNGKVESKEMSL